MSPGRKTFGSPAASGDVHHLFGGEEGPLEAGGGLAGGQGAGAGRHPGQHLVVDGARVLQAHAVRTDDEAVASRLRTHAGKNK